MTSRAREIETLVTTMFAALPLYFTQAIGKMPLLVFHTAMLLIVLRVAIGKGPAIVPPVVMSVPPRRAAARHVHVLDETRPQPRGDADVVASRARQADSAARVPDAVQIVYVREVSKDTAYVLGNIGIVQLGSVKEVSPHQILEQPSQRVITRDPHRTGPQRSLYERP